MALPKARLRVRRLGAYHGAGARHRHGPPIAISDPTPAINEALPPYTRFLGAVKVGNEKVEGQWVLCH